MTRASSPSASLAGRTARPRRNAGLSQRLRQTAVLMSLGESMDFLFNLMVFAMEAWAVIAVALILFYACGAGE